MLRTLVLGRENGIRARLRRAILGGGASSSGPTAPPPVPTSDAGWGGASPEAAEPALGLQPEAPKDVNPPEGFEVVLHRDALAPGSVVEVIIGGTAIAVANVDGTFYATTNSCPHADGPLGEGTLEGTHLTCPYHGWTFDVADGACQTNPDVVIKTYDVEVVDTAVCVRI